MTVYAPITHKGKSRAVDSPQPEPLSALQKNIAEVLAGEPEVADLLLQVRVLTAQNAEMTRERDEHIQRIQATVKEELAKLRALALEAEEENRRLGEQLEQAPPSYFQMVREFHDAARLPNGETPGWREDCHYLRVNLHEEEWWELQAALGDRDLVKTADAIADLIYVLAGTAATFGIDLDRVFAEVHRSNMTKTIDATFRADGKLLKGPLYSPPDIAAALRDPAPNEPDRTDEGGTDRE